MADVLEWNPKINEPELWGVVLLEPLDLTQDHYRLRVSNYYDFSDRDYPRDILAIMNSSTWEGSGHFIYTMYREWQQATRRQKLKRILQ